MAKAATTTTKPEPADLRTVNITSPVEHDGEMHEIGATLTLPAKVAKALVEGGAATYAEPDAPAI